MAEDTTRAADAAPGFARSFGRHGPRRTDLAEILTMAVFVLPTMNRYNHARLCARCRPNRPNRRVALCCDGPNQDPGVRPLLHVWVGSKAPWFTITDTLPQLEEGDAG